MAEQFVKQAIFLTFISFVCSQSATYINSVSNVDLMILENSQRHYTTRFYNGNHPDMLIIRRGGSFQFRVHLNSPFYDTNKIQFHFRLQTEQGNYNVYTPSSNNQGWITELNPNSNTVNVRIILPVNVPVGFWNLYIYTYNSNNLKKFNEYIVRDIFILFNPWLPAETVYLRNTDELDEYIFNESGFIITGSNKYREKRPWIFGQFKYTTIKALKIVLSKLTLSPNERADPVLLSRAFAAIVNIQDDNGIMEGKWRPPYDYLNGYPAQSPLLWVGSPEILEEYVKHNGRSVGYAQCWAFASLIVTFGRALGIPSRAITTYEAGHDYDKNVTIHFELDDYGNVNIDNSESIWNYHVWTEMWMKRYDLSNDGWTYGGWQVLDGTPQQPSTDTDPDNPKYQVGPAPVVAVKQALVNMKYDVNFVYAEVNADTIYRNSYKQVINYKESRIGLGSYTRALNGDVFDVTLNYKEPEGTMADRISFNRAIRAIYGSSAVSSRSSLRRRPQDFQVKWSGVGHQKIGSVIDWYVTVTNDYPEPRFFNVYVNVFSVYYTGEKGHDIFNDRYQLYLEPFSENRRTILINPRDYISKLVPFSYIRTEIMVQTQLRRPVLEMYDLVFEKPTLHIKSYRDTAVIGVPYYIDVQLNNPLNVSLTDCKFAIHGLRLSGDIHSVYPIAPFENRIHRFALVFDASLVETVVIMFVSRELDQVSGLIQVPVYSYYSAGNQFEYKSNHL